MRLTVGSFLLMAIILNGIVSPELRTIANKYDFMFRYPIPVFLTDQPGNSHGIKGCEQASGKAGGCTYWNKQTSLPYLVEVGNTNKNYFEKWFLHELGHFTLRTKDEKRADKYADDMIKLVKGLRGE